MKHLVITAAVFVGIAGYVVARTEPAWFQEAGLDVWNLGSLRDEHKAADSKYEELLVEAERMQQRVAMCEHVAGRLVTDHISLEEGSAEVERICQADATWFEALHYVYHFDTPRILVAHYLIRKVEAMLQTAKAHNDSSLAYQLSTRLDELNVELQLMKSTAASGFATNKPVALSTHANTGLVDVVTPSPLTHP
jgi:hypothetical protein